MDLWHVKHLHAQRQSLLILHSLVLLEHVIFQTLLIKGDHGLGEHAKVDVIVGCLEVSLGVLDRPCALEGSLVEVVTDGQRASGNQARHGV